MNSDTQSQYETTRFVSRFISGVGWVFFWINAILFLPFLVSMIYLLLTGAWGAILIPGGFLVSGAFLMALSLLLVAAGQVTRAIVESADHTLEILSILKDKSHGQESSPIVQALPIRNPAPLHVRAILDEEVIRCGNQPCKRILSDVNATCPHCGAVNS